MQQNKGKSRTSSKGPLWVRLVLLRVLQGTEVPRTSAQLSSAVLISKERFEPRSNIL